MESENPRVSVIIPTYKRSDALCKAINSVLTQTYSNLEVIVVDDNNPDTEWRRETENKMLLYAEDTRVKYLCHDRNRNGSAARNTGIKHSSGQFFCFLDDDDWYYPEKIEKQVRFLIRNNLDACFCDYRKNGTDVVFDKNRDIAKSILLAEPTPQTSGWMVTEKAVRKLHGFDESYYRHQDYEFLLRFIREGFSIGKLDEILYERNITEVDNRPSGKKTEEIKEKLFSDFSDFIDFYSKQEKGFQSKLYISGYAAAFKNYYKQKDIKNCIRLFVKCCRISIPKTFNCYINIMKSHL